MRLKTLAPAFVLFAAASLLLCGGAVPSASAHAELVSAVPAIGSTIPTPPASMLLTFSEEVKPGGITVEVTAPDGNRADTGDAAVDLTNPDRTTVTVSLFMGMAGVYKVHWESTSNLDGDVASGDYTFTVTDTGTATIDSAAVATPTPDPNANGNPLNTSGSFDGRALYLSIGAGILAAFAIYFVWRLVRPKNPKYGSRSGRND